MQPSAGPVIPIFAIPFAALPLTVPAAAEGALAARLAGWATEALRDSGAPADPLCYRSREELFELEDAGVAGLKREMLAALGAIVRSTNAGSAAEVDALQVQARARLIIIRPDGCLPAAMLPLASWGAVYCVAAPPAPAGRALSGVLRLYEPRLGSMFLDGANWRQRPPFANGHHTWRPVPGHMAAFPAYLAHEVALNRADRDLMLVVARARFANAGQEAGPPW